MPSKLQEAVQLGGYFFSDSFTLTTSILQKQVLQILHEYIVISFKTLSDEKWRIRHIITKNIALTNSNRFNLAVNTNHSESTVLAGANHSASTAEQTII